VDSDNESNSWAEDLSDSEDEYDEEEGDEYGEEET